MCDCTKEVHLRDLMLCKSILSRKRRTQLCDGLLERAPACQWAIILFVSVLDMSHSYELLISLVYSLRCVLPKPQYHWVEQLAETCVCLCFAKMLFIELI